MCFRLGPYKCQKCLPSTSSKRYGAHILLRFDLVVVPSLRRFIPPVLGSMQLARMVQVPTTQSRNRRFPCGNCKIRCDKIATKKKFYEGKQSSSSSSSFASVASIVACPRPYTLHPNGRRPMSVRKAIGQRNRPSAA